MLLVVVVVVVVMAVVVVKVVVVVIFMYVAHLSVLDARSPLNIVHAGLDLLLLTIKAADPAAPFVPIDRSTADFIFQMFFASESAINILNDLLQYEHIEAGDVRVVVVVVVASSDV